MINRFFKQFIVTTLGLLMFIAAFVVVVDPFYHYHQPWFGLKPYFYEEVYQTPGIIRNWEFDSVLLGTSMTENFKASWFKEHGCNTVKLSYSGGRTKDFNTILKEIYAKGVRTFF
ncbi:MAG: hypothetical protein HUJ98_09020 [Bacteroidaceae bacterium]|nr:hypothetical protein [Bacteroidaceae bacterium]